MDEKQKKSVNKITDDSPLLADDLECCKNFPPSSVASETRKADDKITISFHDNFFCRQLFSKNLFQNFFHLFIVAFVRAGGNGSARRARNQL